MIKTVGLFKKKEGMSREDFIRYYEEHHAPLALSLLPQILEYRRNYVKHVVPMDAQGQVDTGVVPLGFDVMTEVWVKDEAAQAEIAKTMGDPEIYAIIAADEEKLFDRAHMVMFDVEESPKS